MIDVVAYLSKRVGVTARRIWFPAGNAVNVTLTAKQWRNLLRFLNRHELKRLLVFGDSHKKQPSRLGRVAGEGSTSRTIYRICTVFPELLLQLCGVQAGSTSQGKHGPPESALYALSAVRLKV